MLRKFCLDFQRNLDFTMQHRFFDSRSKALLLQIFPVLTLNEPSVIRTQKTKILALPNYHHVPPPIVSLYGNGAQLCSAFVINWSPSAAQPVEEPPEGTSARHAPFWPLD